MPFLKVARKLFSPGSGSFDGLTPTPLKKATRRIEIQKVNVGGERQQRWINQNRKRNQNQKQQPEVQEKSRKRKAESSSSSDDCSITVISDENTSPLLNCLGTTYNNGNSNKKQKRSRMAGFFSTSTSVPLQQQEVKLSLSKSTWEYVMELVKSQPRSEVPGELRRLMEQQQQQRRRRSELLPTRAAATTTSTRILRSHSISDDNDDDDDDDVDNSNNKENNKNGNYNTKTHAKQSNNNNNNKNMMTKKDDEAADSSKAQTLTVGGHHLRPKFKPYQVGKDVLVGKPLTEGIQQHSKDGWSEAICPSTGEKIHFQVCRDDNDLTSTSTSTADDDNDLHPTSAIQQAHVHLIGRSFADKTKRQDYSEEDAILTSSILQEKGTISFSAWAFGNRRAKEKTLVGSAIVTRATLVRHPNINIFVLSLIAVDRLWRQFGIGRNLLERVEQELRVQEKGNIILAHGLRPSLYFKNGYKLDPKHLPCPFKPKDRTVNYFMKELVHHNNDGGTTTNNNDLSSSMNDLIRKSKPASIDLCSDSLRAYYSDYQQPVRRGGRPILLVDTSTRTTTRSRSAGPPIATTGKSSKDYALEEPSGRPKTTRRQRVSATTTEQEEPRVTRQRPFGRRLRARFA